MIFVPNWFTLTLHAEWNDHCSQFVWKGGVLLKVAFAGQNTKEKLEAQHVEWGLCSIKDFILSLLSILVLSRPWCLVIFVVLILKMH
jgi:hypothetical protein